MALNGFAPSSFSSLSAQSGSVNVALPGAGTNLLIVNLGPSPAAVLLSESDVATVSGSTGTVVMPGGSLVLTVGTNTRLAAVAVGFGSAWLNLSVGA